MSYLDKYIDDIKKFEQYSKEISECIPDYKGKEHSMTAIYSHLVKYWNCASDKIKSHFEFEKPKYVWKFIQKIEKGEEGCPVMYLKGKNSKPCLSVLRVVNVENNDVPPILTRTRKLTQPYLLDAQGMIQKTVEPKRITKWSIPILLEVLFQTLYFGEVLPANDKEEYNKALSDFIAMKSEYAKNQKAIIKKAKQKEDEKETKSSFRPFIRIISVPMGGMNKYKK